MQAAAGPGALTTWHRRRRLLACLPMSPLRPLDRALGRAVAALVDRQQADGSWELPCEFDPSFSALFLLLRHYLGRRDDALDAAIASHLRHRQLAGGGWGGSPDSPAGLDITVLCYTAMRAAGVAAADPALAAARTAIHDAGGLAAAGFVPRLMLWQLGQIPGRALPYVSPRFIRLPHPLHLDRLRLLALGVVPFSLLDGAGARPLPPDRGIAELAPGRVRWRARPVPAGPAPRWPRRLGERGTWAVLERLGEILRVVDRAFPPARARAAAVRWLLDRHGPDGTFGEGLVPTTLALMALANHPGGACAQVVEQGLRTLGTWLVTDARGSWLPASPSTTHDTARVLEGLRHFPCGQAATAAARWLFARQSTTPGFWGGRPERAGGWCFGRVNPWLTDTDDTAIVLHALRAFRPLDPAGWRRGVDWLLAAQGRDGGWAGFTKDYGSLCRTIAAITDPAVAASVRPDADITARALIVLAALDNDADDPDGRIRSAVARGARFLWRQRRPDATWPGHWWVNHAYGTAQAIEALAACGHGADPRLAGSARWLERVQNPDGGWGESKRSYLTGRHEPGPSSPLVTAAVLRGLVAAGLAGDGAVRRAVAYLLAARGADGLWSDPGWSGVFVPGASYLRYDPNGFVLAALALVARGRPGAAA